MGNCVSCNLQTLLLPARERAVAEVPIVLDGKVIAKPVGNVAVTPCKAGSAAAG